MFLCYLKIDASITVEFNLGLSITFSAKICETCSSVFHNYPNEYLVFSLNE